MSIPEDDPDFATLPVPLGLALARLPQEAPDANAWPMLRQRLDARHRARRPRWPLALAASVALGWLLLPGTTGPGLDGAGTIQTDAGMPSSAAASGAAGTAALAALMSESQRLERLIAAADDGASSASAAAIGVEFESRLQAIDGALEAAPAGPRQLDLWQRRVQLLRDVAAMETSRRYLASEGTNFDVALVAAY
jgi:hypothetical protein